MEWEIFCNKFCPMPFRGKFRNGDEEVDCDLEDTECPFRNVDFSKVTVYENLLDSSCGE